MSSMSVSWGDNLIGACRVSRVNRRGFRKLSRVRKIEFLLFPTFPKTISITIALKLVVNKFLAHWIISDLIWKDLWDEDNIAELLKDMIRLEAPIPTVASMLVSVKQKKCAGTGEGRYLPTRSKTCRLQTAKREKKELKIKLIGLLHNRTESLQRSKPK